LWDIEEENIEMKVIRHVKIDEEDDYRFRPTGTFAIFMRSLKAG
jgi:hypothetical protein